MPYDEETMPMNEKSNPSERTDVATSVSASASAIASILDKVQLPAMARIEQVFDDTKVEDIPGVVRDEFLKPVIRSSIKPGDRIAIAIGSRGVANVALIIKSIVENVKAMGGAPFVVAAMGSHGGATPEGKLAILNDLGITDNSVGAPIVSQMKVIQLGETESGVPVFFDKEAIKADGIIVVGRIKPHTAYRGEYESGLYKMMAIGLANQIGAEACHKEGFGKMAANVPDIARIVLKKAPIIMGVGIVENAYDDTCIIEAISPEQIDEREPQLLLKAKELMPRIMFPEFDILIVDEIGKNYSGDGMDPNITGRYATPYAKGGPKFQKCVVLDISRETHGNGNGLGLTDFATRRAFDKVDFDATYVNALTSRVTKTANMPVILKNDRSAIAAAIHTAIGVDTSNARIVRISNTSHIGHIQISQALIAEAELLPDVRHIEDAKPLQFDGEGNLL